MNRYGWGVLAIAAAACGPSSSPGTSPAAPAAASPPAEPGTPGEEPMSTAIPGAPWTIDYADGSANAYHLSNQGADADILFEYLPVTPERSSSGSYSGGPPRREVLVADDSRLAELWSLVSRLEADTSLHTPERAKGTGALTVMTADGKREFIVKRGPALKELDDLLARFGAP